MFADLPLLERVLLQENPSTCRYASGIGLECMCAPGYSGDGTYCSNMHTRRAAQPRAQAGAADHVPAGASPTTGGWLSWSSMAAVASMMLVGVSVVVWRRQNSNKYGGGGGYEIPMYARAHW